MSNGKYSISYHGTCCRYSKIIPLRSYSDQPSSRELSTLERIDFQLKNVRLIICLYVDHICCFLSVFSASSRNRLLLSNLQSAHQFIINTSTRDCCKIMLTGVLRYMNARLSILFSMKYESIRTMSILFIIFSCTNVIQTLVSMIPIYREESVMISVWPLFHAHSI